MKSYSKSLLYIFGLVFLINIGYRFSLNGMFAEGTETERKKSSDLHFLDLVKTGSSEEVELLLKEDGRLVNVQDEGGNTALHWIVYNHDKKMFDMILKFNPNVNKIDIHKRSPLMIAIRGRRRWCSKDPEKMICPFDLVKNLIYEGADVELKDINDDTALHYAARCDDKKAAKSILEKNSEMVDVKNCLGNTPLLVSVSESENCLTVPIFLYYRANPNEASEEGENPLEIAVSRYEIQSTFCLLWYGADKDRFSDLGNFPNIIEGCLFYERFKALSSMTKAEIDQKAEKSYLKLLVPNGEKYKKED